MKLLLNKIMALFWRGKKTTYPFISRKMNPIYIVKLMMYIYLKKNHKTPIDF
jgi:hypothetical protein